MKKKKVNPNEYCAICKDFHDFILPDDLFEALVRNELVIFAGAGVSTENKNVFPYTLYEDIIEELGDSPNKDISFSEVMSKYCKKTGGKQELINRIRSRIDYVFSFPDLYNSATRFHQQLSQIPCITEIVTTNWDDFFERECHATPFTYEQDMAFWDKTTRKVLKLHGSINNLGSLVATTEDYEKCYQSLNTGLIGSQLKVLITNRRLIFVGYSFADEDFNRIYSFVRGQLKDFMKKPYIVTLDELNDSRWRNLGLEPIYTDGYYFLHVLTHKLELKGCLIPNQSVKGIYKELKVIRGEHIRLANTINLFEYPEAIYCLSYQDGIIHALEHFLHHVSYGESLCKNDVRKTIITYKNLIDKKRKSRKWYDVAYLMGYLNGHVFAMATNEERKHFPRYLDLSLNNELRTPDEYKDSLNITKGRKKAIINYASNVVKKRIPDESIILQHTPFLL
jgi:hypothetical protein